jgi:hypothetical protein
MFREALTSAIWSVTGKQPGSNQRTNTWINTRVRLYEEQGDKYLLLFKSFLNALMASMSEGAVQLNNCARGQVLPHEIIDVRRFKLLQYLKLRRALPLPDSDTISTAKKAYVAKATASFASRPLPRSVARRVMGMGKPFKATVPEIRASDLVSGSGCYERKRSQGGRSSILTGLRSSAGTRQLLEKNYLKGVIPSPADLPTYRLDSATSEYLKSNPLVKPIPMRVSMVAESGLKVRGVTKSPARVVAGGQAYRRHIFPFLEKDKRAVTSQALVDPELLEIHFHRGERRSGLRVFSADFTDATTSMSHEALACFCEAFGVPPELVFEGHTISGKPVTTGCPMGLPVSWTALSVVHLAVCEVIDPTGSYRLKGDDLIALWSPAQIEGFIALAAQVGLVVNNKSMTHKSIGTFCEGDYLLEHVGHKSFVLRRQATFSLRSFAVNEILPHDDAERLVARGVSRDLLYAMQQHFHKMWIRLATEKNVNPYAPRSLGGLGMVSSPDRQLDPVTCRIVNSANNGTLLFKSKDTIKYTALSGMLMSVYNSVPYSVRGDARAESLLEKAFLANFGACSFLDALERPLDRVEVPSPGKLVRSLWAYRRRYLRAKIPSVLVPTTVGTAYDVLSRLKPGLKGWTEPPKAITLAAGPPKRTRKRSF